MSQRRKAAVKPLISPQTTRRLSRLLRNYDLSCVGTLSRWIPTTGVTSHNNVVNIRSVIASSQGSLLFLVKVSLPTKVEDPLDHESKYTYWKFKCIARKLYQSQTERYFPNHNFMWLISALTKYFFLRLRSSYGFAIISTFSRWIGNLRIDVK